MSIEIEIRGPSPHCLFLKHETSVYFFGSHWNSTIAFRVEILPSHSTHAHRWVIQTTFALITICAHRRFYVLYCIWQWGTTQALLFDHINPGRHPQPIGDKVLEYAGQPWHSSSPLYVLYLPKAHETQTNGWYSWREINSDPWDRSLSISLC